MLKVGPSHFANEQAQMTEDSQVRILLDVSEIFQELAELANK